METPFHPQVIHFPIAGLMLAALAYLISMFYDAPGMLKTGLFLHIAGVLGCAAAVLSGDDAEHALNMTHEIHEVVEKHELFAYITLWVYALLALWAGFRRTRMVRGEHIGFAVVFALCLLLVWMTGHEGGEIVYELRALCQ